jgi:hypothetical protein
MDAFSPTQKRSIESAEDWDVYPTITGDVTFRYECRAIIVGVPGTLNVRKLDGTIGTDPLPEMPAGYRHDVVGSGIESTGTTAGGIIVLY